MMGAALSLKEILLKQRLRGIERKAKTAAKRVGKKKNKAMMMLAAIDKNAGGKIAKSNRAPDDDDLMMALLNKPMVLLLQIWAMEDAQTGETKKGNWVASVSPVAGGAAPAKVAPAPAAEDDDIPF